MSKLFLLLDYKLCHFLLYRPPTSLFGLFGLYLFRPNVEQSRHLPSSFCYFLFIGEAVGWQRFYFLADNKNNVDDDDDDENSQATPSTKKVSRLILATPPAPPPSHFACWRVCGSQKISWLFIAISQSFARRCTLLPFKFYLSLSMIHF